MHTGASIEKVMPMPKKSGLGLQRPSVTGLAAYGVEQQGHHLMATDSTSNYISFFDLRMIMDKLDLRHNRTSNIKSINNDQN